MRKFTSFLILLLCPAIAGFGQVVKPFTSGQSGTSPADEHIKAFQSVQFDRSAFDQFRHSIPKLESLSGLKASNMMIELPLHSGNELFFIAEQQVLSLESAALYPLIKTYKLASTDGSKYGSITYSQLGLSIMLFTEEGRLYITPFSNMDAVNHAVYLAKDYQLAPGSTIACEIDAAKTIREHGQVKYKTTAVLGDCTLRNYKLAVAATGEYTTWAGSQANAVASITATIANVNVIYERDVAIHFILVIDNSVIFTNAASDPYTGTLDMTALNTNTATLTTALGLTGYDVGILFNNGWNGGLAFTPGVCDASYKGGAGAGINGTPSGSIMEGVVAHEIAHMFSALHTLSSGTGVGCLNNVSLSAAYEPGGGSTLMGYAGSVCSGQFYQNYTDGYFHYNSVSAILGYAQASATCNTTTPNTNAAPTLSVAATSYTIPHSTPFQLDATLTDVTATGTPTYSFEQYDLAPAIMTVLPSALSISGPVFRSYPPSVNSYRIFPPLSNILNNTATPWEVLPSVSRTINFKVTGRDNEPFKGCVAQESIAVNVSGGSGPFAITSQNTATTFTANGSNTIPLTWSVANSDVAPVNSPNVDILFSTDNGQTFPYTLVSNTANDGSENIIVPNLNTTVGRIKVKSSNNIFFDINNAALSISTTCSANGATITPNINVSAVLGSAALNLGLTPAYGSPLTIAGTLASTDPSANLVVNNNTAGTCIAFGNTFRYDLFTFQVNVSGSYTFTQSGSTPYGVMCNLYQTAFVPGTQCPNFLNSNGTYNSTTFIINLGTSFTQTLSAGVTYVLAVGTFDNNLPTLPAAYTVNVTPPAGGALYNGVPDPGPTFAYKYVVVNNATGNIVSISSTSDMTSSVTYYVGNFKVYGVSVSTSVSASTLNSYVGGSYTNFLAALLNSTICGNLSTNSINVNITPFPLALRFIALRAQKGHNDIDVNWTVANQSGTEVYEVERSSDGQNFETIGSVSAAAITEYMLKDEQPFAGINYYRIKAILRDGVAIYSSIVRVQFGTDDAASLNVYPNPATGSGILLSMVNVEQGKYTLAVYNLTAQNLLKQEIDHEGGSTTVNVNIESLVAGAYFISVIDEQGKTIYRQKLIRR